MTSFDPTVFISTMDNNLSRPEVATLLFDGKVDWDDAVYIIRKYFIVSAPGACTILLGDAAWREWFFERISLDKACHRRYIKTINTFPGEFPLKIVDGKIEYVE
ncbi:MAG: hypothetical protein KJ551_00985 [Alphaproteobacteria bacterium]|nr:hypothetical protein [Alphaproteobacteria bacterium]